MQESQKEQEESTNEFALGGNMKTRNKNKPFNLSEAGNTLARGGKLRGISTNFGDSVNGIATRNVNLFAEGGSLNSSEVAQLQELADLDPAILTELMGQDDVPEGT